MPRVGAGEPGLLRKIIHGCRLPRVGAGEPLGLMPG